MNERTKQLTTLSMLGAISFIATAAMRIPIILPFLKYDPKDVIITIGGFIYGPFAAFMLSAIVSLIESFTVSDTGPLGLIMNIISSCAFACTASYIYKKIHTLKGAVIGLITGVIAMTAVMLLWNYLIVPLYMTLPREEVAGMLIPVFLPFNLIKGSINAGITVLAYKPLVKALRKSGLVAPSQQNETKRAWVGASLISLFVLASCIMFVLINKGSI